MSEVDPHVQHALDDARLILPTIAVQPGLTHSPSSHMLSIGIDKDAMAAGIVNADISVPIDYNFTSTGQRDTSLRDLSIATDAHKATVWVGVSQARKRQFENQKKSNQQFWLGALASELALGGSEAELRRPLHARAIRAGVLAAGGITEATTVLILATDGQETFLDKLAAVGAIGGLVLFVAGSMRLMNVYDTEGNYEFAPVLVREPKIYPSRKLKREAARLAKKYPVIAYPNELETGQL